MFAKLFSAVAVSSVLLTASVAYAEETEATKPAPRTESHWYGYQTLATDAAAIATAAVSLSADSPGVQAVGGTTAIATYAVAPVIIHAVHGHGGKAIGDAIMRIVLPAVGVGVGALVGIAMWEPTADAGLATPIVNTVTLAVAMWEGAAIGGLVGGGTAIAIDAAALGHEEVKVGQHLRDERPQAKAQPRPSGPTFHPTARPTRDGGFVAGLGGTF